MALVVLTQCVLVVCGCRSQLLQRTSLQVCSSAYTAWLSTHSFFASVSHHTYSVLNIIGIESWRLVGHYPPPQKKIREATILGQLEVIDCFIIDHTNYKTRTELKLKFTSIRCDVIIFPITMYYQHVRVINFLTRTPTSCDDRFQYTLSKALVPVCFSRKYFMPLKQNFLSLYS